jgi:hypothetical protein
MSVREGAGGRKSDGAARNREILEQGDADMEASEQGWSKKERGNEVDLEWVGRGSRREAWQQQRWRC